MDTWKGQRQAPRADSRRHETTKKRDSSRTGLRAFVVAWLIGPPAVLAATSCTAGPNYKKPVAPLPATLKEEPVEGSALANDWKAAQPRDDQIRDKWWESFADPGLNAL